MHEIDQMDIRRWYELVTEDEEIEEEIEEVTANEIWWL